MKSKIIKFTIFLLAIILLLVFAQPIWVRIENKVPTSIESRLNHFFGRKTILERLEKKPEVSVSISEGQNLKEIAGLLAVKKLSSENDFFRFAGTPKVAYIKKDSIAIPKNYSLEFDFLKDREDDSSLEGYLFPDTYRFFQDATADEIITKMLENFDRKLTPKMRSESAAQGKTISPIVIMASLIEKETPINYLSGDNHDAKIITGIFWNHLKKGQALQSCATLAYVL